MSLASSLDIECSLAPLDNALAAAVITAPLFVQFACC